MYTWMYPTILLLHITWTLTGSETAPTQTFVHIVARAQIVQIFAERQARAVIRIFRLLNLIVRHHYGPFFVVSVVVERKFQTERFQSFLVPQRFVSVLSLQLFAHRQSFHPFGRYKLFLGRYKLFPCRQIRSLVSCSDVLNLFLVQIYYFLRSRCTSASSAE